MTVGELRTLLSRYPDEAHVCVHSDDGEIAGNIDEVDDVPDPDTSVPIVGIVFDPKIDWDKSHMETY